MIPPSCDSKTRALLPIPWRHSIFILEGWGLVRVDWNRESYPLQLGESTQHTLDQYELLRTFRDA